MSLLVDYHRMAKSSVTGMRWWTKCVMAIVRFGGCQVVQVELWTFGLSAMKKLLGTWEREGFGEVGR